MSRKKNSLENQIARVFPEVFFFSTFLFSPKEGGRGFAISALHFD
jgi:hypothetical protein